jgi:predicted acylesterase/phospholipase RssA
VLLTFLAVGCSQVPHFDAPANLASTCLVSANGPPPEDDAVAAEDMPPSNGVARASFEVPVTQRPLNLLALSGGGMYGAFDVGVLCGWTASGQRPKFDVVTGISTGALIATFAFLGPRYDDFLRDSYVNITSDDIFRLKWLPAALFSDALASSEPLRRRIEQAITPAVLREVAAAHAEGRRLYVGTTNLDTRRLVVWDMGAIASRGTPQSLTLYRQVVLASASVPGFFPPVCLDVVVDGRRYHELHVDGGASASVFLGAPMLHSDPRDPHVGAGSNLYVITSGKLYADPEGVTPSVLNISASAISSMLYASNRSDLFRLYSLARMRGIHFNLLAVPQDFPLNPNGLSFDREEMQGLFEEGQRLGSEGKAWRQTPPGAEPGERVPPRSGVQLVTEKPAAAR